MIEKLKAFWNKYKVAIIIAGIFTAIVIVAFLFTGVKELLYTLFLNFTTPFFKKKEQKIKDNVNGQADDIKEGQQILSELETKNNELKQRLKEIDDKKATMTDQEELEYMKNRKKRKKAEGKQ